MTRPDALLWIMPGCAFCPGVHKALETLVAEGAIGRLEVVDIPAQPERAAAAGIRSAPWTRIGPFELEGNRTLGELRGWAERAAAHSGFDRYYRDLLESRRLAQALAALRQHPDTLHDLLKLLADPETPLPVRIGVGAVLEELEGSELLKSGLSELVRLCRSEDAALRADACHYLGLTHSPEALPTLQALLADPDIHVREIAEESRVMLLSQTG
jgi:hypothetical protein